MKKKKQHNSTQPSLRTVAAEMLTILSVVYLIWSSTFKWLSDMRLHKLGYNGDAMLVNGLVAVLFWCSILLLVGHVVVHKMSKRPTISICGIVILTLAFLTLTVYFISRDFPHGSASADLISEVMIITMLALIFSPIVDFVRSSRSQNAYDQKFRVIVVTYTFVYLFLWPALIGDVITIVSI